MFEHSVSGSFLSIAAYKSDLSAKGPFLLCFHGPEKHKQEKEKKSEIIQLNRIRPKSLLCGALWRRSEAIETWVDHARLSTSPGVGCHKLARKELPGKSTVTVLCDSGCGYDTVAPFDSSVLLLFRFCAHSNTRRALSSTS